MLQFKIQNSKFSILNLPYPRTGAPHPVKMWRAQSDAPWRFNVPMHGIKAVGAFHEPYEFRVRARIESGGGPPHSKTLARRPQSLELPPGFGVRRPCGAFAWQVPGPNACGKSRKGAFHEPGSAGIPAGELLESRRRGRRHSRETAGGFMVPMHAENSQKGALHEPTPDPSQEGNWPRRPAPLLGGAGGGFMVPMHEKKSRKWAFHEPTIVLAFVQHSKAPTA